MTRLIAGLAAGGLIVLGACGLEDATGVGGPLLPGGAVRSFELLLDPAQYLLSDTSVAGFTRTNEAPFVLVARAFAGELNAHALIRFARAPATVVYTDATGTQRTDTLPSYIGGSLVIAVDTVATRAAGPVQLSLFRTAEQWDPATATWALRVDSATARHPWTQPGGTVGAQVDTASWRPGRDTVFIPVDSATVAAWSDTTDVKRGALVRAETPGSRLQVSSIVLRLRARPSARPDTIVTTAAGAIGKTFVFDPMPTPVQALQVGGVPSWRAFVAFDPRLGEIPVTGCVPGGRCIRLKDATINHAALRLQPRAVSGAFLPTDSMVIEARAVLKAGGVPVARAPLGNQPAGVTTPAVPASLFAPGGIPAPVDVPITPFIATLVAVPDSGQAPPPTALALFQRPEAGAFGIAAFGARTAGAPAFPRLRIIVTVATEIEIR